MTPACREIKKSLNAGKYFYVFISDEL